MNQRKFLQAMLSTVAHTRNPFKIIKVIDVTSENVKTDLTFTEMLSLGRRLQGPVHHAQCPGRTWIARRPADRAQLAAVTWRHTSLTLCPTCRAPALVGYLDRAPVAYACHRCPANADTKKPA
jgi:hypothetical protein